jgi:Na+-transporting NADH:ubiquinone oxidoreductase subunit C
VNPNWRALWAGKKVYNDAGEPILALIKGVVDKNKPGSEYQVDGLAGATLTSNGVSNLVKYWMSAEGFAPYLDKIRKKG